MKLDLNKNKILVLAVLFGLILLLPLALNLTKQRQEIRKKAVGSGIVRLQLQPGQTSINKGDYLDINVVLNSTQPAVQVNAANVKMLFDKTIFDVSGVNCGAEFPLAVEKRVDITGSSGYIYLACATEGGTLPITLQTDQPHTLGTFRATVKNSASLGEFLISFDADVCYVNEHPSGNNLSDASFMGRYTITSAATPTPLPTPLPGQERVVGRVLKNTVPGTGYSISSHDGKQAVWSTNEGGPYYALGAWATGSVVKITLNNPDAGFNCSWSFDNNPNQTGGETSGSNCLAVVTLSNTSWDWQNHLTFFLSTPPTSTPVPTATLTPIPTATITPMPTGGATGTPTPTVTGGVTGTPIPTPTVTSTPGQVKIRFKIKFAGVETQKPAQKVKLTVRHYNSGTTATLANVDVASVKVGEIWIYQSGMITLPAEITPGTGYQILIKGPKHLQALYCERTGQVKPCSGGAYIYTMPLAAGENEFDFGGYPLLAGDLPLTQTGGQDGVVNSIDAVALTNCFDTPESQACKDTADLNFDGTVNTLDMNLMNNTIYSRWEDD